jgi:tetratricopeptide (TPR) repeat protein
MTSLRRWMRWTGTLGLSLWVAAAGDAGASQMFPAAELEEAHTLRQRILSEVPQLDPRQLRGEPRLSPETLTQIQQRLAAVQAREAENPFFHWAQGEVLRQTQGSAAAAPALERARQSAGQRFLIHWMLWQDFIGRDLREEARREERALQAIQLTWGLSRFPLLAAEEMRLGADAALSGELTRAVTLYDAALANAPESPEAVIRRAALTWQVDKSRLLQVIRDLGAGVFQSLRGPYTGFRLTGNLLLSLLVAWLTVLVLVAMILGVKTQPLFSHALSERLLKTLPQPAQASLGLLLFVLPFMLGLGLLWAAVVALLLSAPHLSRRELCVVSVLLAVLVLFPFAYGEVAARHVVASSRHLALVQAAEQGGRGETLGQELHRWILDSPNNGLPHYYLALVLKRRGDLAQAEAEMSQAAQLLPGEGFVQVGLGNLQYLRGRLPEAEASYHRAAEMLPLSAPVQINLSKLYTQRLQLDQSNQALTRSFKLDPHTARTVSYFHGQGMTQFVLDESVPWVALAAGLTPRMGEVRPVAEGLWGTPLRGVCLVALPYVTLGVLVLFWGRVMWRGGTPGVRRCQQCGMVYCGKCHSNPKEKEYCGPCASVLRQREGVAAFSRIRRIREGEEWLRRERARVGILGSLVPGGSDLYKGRVILGLLLCLPAIWLLIEGVVLDLVTPSFRFTTPLPGPVRWTLALAPVFLLYVYSMRRSWGRSGTAAR